LALRDKKHMLAVRTGDLQQQIKSLNHEIICEKNTFRDGT
jgi:hypothetical protein